ncbi:MAG: arsenate reductase (glutaredoxin) [Rhizobiales bacterium]|nr:arsenate reductase (glutaredoxin) [Hyphomicrobiales bacterium]NRB14385.1 arsenate reductase (glutaredoxin) [Hyphomicrobiales bacterium]
MTVTIYHNSRCSKSRAALAYLESQNVEFDIVTYLEGQLDAPQLQAILQTLGMSAKDVMRKGEKIYKQLGLANEHDEAKLIKAIIANPILLERPIVVKDNNAAIGRPLENIIQLFD